jgi:hypothetical protein
MGKFLGRIPDTHRSTDLALKNYLDLPTLLGSQDVPAAPNWHAMARALNPTWSDTDALGNDRAGCCVYSAPGHLLNLVDALTASGRPPVTESDVIAAYAQHTGYDPVTGANDGGEYIRAMIDIWAGAGLYSSKLAAFCAVDRTNAAEMAIAAWLGPGLIGGYDLPIVAQSQTDSEGRQLWAVPAGGWPAGQGPGTWGGHCIHQHGVSEIDRGNSWGEGTHWSRDWHLACCSELWLCIPDRWQFATGRAPNGFAFDDLIADTKARAGK